MTDPAAAADVATIRRAIDRYHELLRGPAGEASARRLEAGLQRTRLVFGDRPICRVLRPLFLTAAEAQWLRSESEILLQAFRKVRRALEDDRQVRTSLGLTKDEEAILAADRQPFEPDAIARIDGFRTPDGSFKVIEYNAESPGGIAFGDVLSDLFLSLPVVEEFSREYRLQRFGGLDNTLRELIAAHRARLGPSASAHPAIAVVDFLSAPTRREFEICADHFARHGCPSRVAEAADLTYENGRLRAGDFVIDVVYKRVLVKDLLLHGGASHPLVRAVKDGTVTCAGGFGVHLLFRKDLFALLGDTRFSRQLSAGEQAAVARCIPWTRVVEDVETEHEGRRLRLLELIRNRRERLVLKPVSEYGGSGVALGWLLSPSEWEAALKQAIERPHVVQERVDLPSETFPMWDGHRIRFSQFFADTNPFVWGGVRSEGFGARLAAGELLNVTAGGGSAVPVFVIEPAARADPAHSPK